MPHSLTFAIRHPYGEVGQGISLPVTITAGAQSVELLAKLDTGADICIFQRGYAEALGIPIESGDYPTISTVTGAFGAYGHDLILAVCGLDFECKAYFYEHTGYGRNVLGRTWLRSCRVAIIEHDTEFYLSRYND